MSDESEDISLSKLMGVARGSCEMSRGESSSSESNIISGGERGSVDRPRMPREDDAILEIATCQITDLEF